MAKVLLLGGTGAIGIYLQDALLSLGYEVVVTSRSQRESNTVRFVLGNAKDVLFLQRVLKEEAPDAVVDFMKYGSIEFPVFRDIFLNSLTQYVFLSSYRVFANQSPLVETSTRLLDEKSDLEYLKTDEYALSKAREEDALRISKNRNWTIVRPAITFSSNRFQFGCLEADTVCYRSLHGLPIVVPHEMLDRHTTMTWGKDVATLISRLVLNPVAYGEDFNVATSETHTWREIAKIYHDTIGMQMIEVSLDWYCNLCNRYQVLYDRMFDRVVDNKKVLKATGLSQSAFTPLPISLHEELQKFMKHPIYKSMNVRQNALMDKVCRSRIPLSDLSFRECKCYCQVRYPFIGTLMKKFAAVFR